MVVKFKFLAVGVVGPMVQNNVSASQLKIDKKFAIMVRDFSCRSISKLVIPTQFQGFPYHAKKKSLEIFYYKQEQFEADTNCRIGNWLEPSPVKTGLGMSIYNLQSDLGLNIFMLIFNQAGTCGIVWSG